MTVGLASSAGGLGDEVAQQVLVAEMEAVEDADDDEDRPDRRASRPSTPATTRIDRSRRRHRRRGATKTLSGARRAAVRVAMATSAPSGARSR